MTFAVCKTSHYIYTHCTVQYIRAREKLNAQFSAILSVQVCVCGCGCATVTAVHTSCTHEMCCVTVCVCVCFAPIRRNGYGSMQRRSARGREWNWWNFVWYIPLSLDYSPLNSYLCILHRLIQTIFFIFSIFSSNKINTHSHRKYMYIYNNIWLISCSLHQFVSWDIISFTVINPYLYYESIKNRKQIMSAAVAVFLALFFCSICS